VEEILRERSGSNGFMECLALCKGQPVPVWVEMVYVSNSNSYKKFRKKQVCHFGTSQKHKLFTLEIVLNI